MRNSLIYILFVTISVLFSLQSCSLEELDSATSIGGGKNYIEFIARPTSYNKTEVATKSAVSDIESAVHNAFLLVFDNNTKARILCKEITNPSTAPSTSIPLDKGLTNVTACFLINVPASFAQGIKGLEKPANDANAQNNEYINTAVLDGITYGTGSNFGIPYIDLDGPAEGSNSAVACIPMFGMSSVNLASGSTSAQITIKRLFAKVTVDLTLDMDLDNWTDELVELNTNLQLNYYELRNMPNRVRLSESTSQCAWVSDPNAFSSTAISSGRINKKIYIKGSSTSNNKTCIFEFYAPEYYLNRATEWTNDEKSKPNNKPSDAKAINLFLDTTFSQYTFTTTDLQYEIYLGRDAISDFSLARNVNYINTLTVKGIEQTDLDHRVTTTVINNPVAQEGMSANCYVIGKVGPYYFPAYKGAYNDLTKAVLCSNPNAELVELANDNPNNIVLTNKVYDVDNNIVSFEIEKIADGNVVIALVDDKGTPNNTEDDEIEWSWHLWCSTTSEFDVLGWGKMKTNTYPTTAIMMDRNLGASSNTEEGLYYQYGNKNPYIGKYCGGGENGTFTWDPTLDSNTNDNAKSVYDPCPPGYKVPTNAVWGDVAGTEASSNVLFSYCTSPSIVNYYYHGLREAANNNTPLKETSSQTDTLSASGFKIDISESSTTKASPNHTNTSSEQYQIKTTTVREYINIKYNMPTKQKFGGFWTSDTYTFFKYYNYVADWSKLSLSNITTFMTMVECDYREHVYSVEQKRTKRILTWGSWSDITDPTTISDTITPGDADDLQEINNGFTGLTSNKVLLWYHERDITTLGAQNTLVLVEENHANGYSVRCVSETSPVQ